MTFREILQKFRTESFTEREKGTKFERLMQLWLKTDPRYNDLRHVWLWEEFPGRKDFGGSDIGIDLVAKTEQGDYWAIQCKCYKETATIDKATVDSFIATSGKSFKDADTFQTVRFSNCLWISTTNHWGNNAEQAIRNQDPPVNRIGLLDLENSPVDWKKLLEGLEGKAAMLSGKQLMKHQLEAISKANEYYKDHDRGKLIMACGTGKTFTSLRLVEQLTGGKGLVLFMVPSISLLNQSLNAWMADAKKTMKAVCVCSDNKASQKKNDDSDDTVDTVVDLALPASTDKITIARRLNDYRNHDGLVVVFSTYQSIDAVSEAQKQVLADNNGQYGVFDFIVCDEAHRTTGLHDGVNEGNFTKIHSNDNVQGKKRLYMTATPRLYTGNAKSKAQEKDLVLCSMDDPALYGEEFFRVNFSYAVQNGLLTDYKVFVLTVDEADIKDNVYQRITDNSQTEYNFDDTGKLIGVINGLSKIVRGDGGKTWEADPRMMKRALAFCSTTGKTGKSKDQPGTSVVVAKTLPVVSRMVEEGMTADQLKNIVSVSAKHIDGGMNASERNELLGWLSEDSEDPRECRVLTNVRCLSEGVDVPALDAVLFLSARNSQVDVVQSVGRVMRNFRKGKPDEKKYGYIIIPIVTPANVSAEEALNNSHTFDVVWSILNALRSHDDSFNAEVNKIQLNKDKSTGKIIVGTAGIGTRTDYGDANDTHDHETITNQDIARQLNIRFAEYEKNIYAKLVEKCGDRMYWENWAREIGMIATRFIERIGSLVGDGSKYEHQFNEFLSGLQKNLNPSVDRGQAVEMLAQHMICRPVFDALFEEYQFVKNNAVSISMQRMLDILHDEAFEKDTVVLDSFYKSVKMNVGDIDNLEGKQTIIKNLYEQFFKGAFPKTVDKLGIVYTPVECVDFIIHSVDDILQREFHSSLTKENVHILDPFTGTGTFMTRLLQSGLIKPEDMERKYRNEIHCNELVLLAYYVADINIESVFHDLTKREEYLPFDGICLTDTFQQNEGEDKDIFSMLFPKNSDRVLKQKKAPIRVIIGNPPYSAGQKSANDNAQNLSYAKLDGAIARTYVKKSQATLKNSTYDTYIKAFRWSSDRIEQMKEGGVIAFISNGGWLDGNAQDGFRQCIEEEFTDIYVLNLRGNQRTSGELSRKEGGKIFGSGSRTPITITFLVRNPEKYQKEGNKAKIHYHDIGDYLSREDKLSMVKDFRSIYTNKIEWEEIVPNEKNDWINQRGDLFDTLIALSGEKECVFSDNFPALGAFRDAWVYNYSSNELRNNIEKLIDNYNDEVIKMISMRKNNKEYNISKDIEKDETKISWTANLKSSLLNEKELKYVSQSIVESMYRPFQKEYLYSDRNLIERPGKMSNVFGQNQYISNLLIGTSAAKNFTSLISKIYLDRHTVGDSQCFPLYYFEEKKAEQLSLFDEPNANGERYTRRDGITDWILKEVRKRYSTKSITKEDIFYYVYGLLHSEDYRKAFEADLKKSLPRIPIVESAADFKAFSQAGRDLANLHLNYEDVEPCREVVIRHIGYGLSKEDTYYASEYGADGIGMVADGISEEEWYDMYKVTKMSFGKMDGVDKKGKSKKVDDKSVIIYNANIRLENIPEKAYEYIVNGKSAIEWIMERYQITTDKKSGIKNDPNDWSREHQQPKYIFDLLLSVINVSCLTVDIVKNLPKLKFQEQ